MIALQDGRQHQFILLIERVPDYMILCCRQLEDIDPSISGHDGVVRNAVIASDENLPATQKLMSGCGQVCRNSLNERSQLKTELRE